MTSSFVESFNVAGKLSSCIIAQSYTLQITENSTWQNTQFCLFMDFFFFYTLSLVVLYQIKRLTS